MRTALAAIVIVIAAVPAGAAPPVERGWAMHAGGGIALASPAFSATSTFTEFAEEGSIATRNEPGSGGELEAGISRFLSRKLGVALTVARSRRDAPGTFSAALPHPLYLDRHRMVEGALPDGAQRETAVHLGLVWSATLGGLTARISGGPSYILAEADLVDGVTHTGEYPFDVAEVTSVAVSPARGDALGGHAGLTLEHRVGGRVGLSAGARWSRASVPLERTAPAESGAAQDSVRLQAGGVTVGASLRLYF